jgi:hypothetical protein
MRVIFNLFKNSRGYSQVKVNHWYQRHWRQILPPLLLVSLIPVANCGKFAMHANDTSDKELEQLLTPESEGEGKKLSVCEYRNKILKIIKTFLIEDFFHLPPVSMTPVVD